MDSEMQALIVATARITGMSVLDKAIEHTDQAGVYFFFDLYGGSDGKTMTPIKGTTYPHSQLLIDHGASKFGVAWERWSPLEDSRAMFEVINVLLGKGFEVNLYIHKDKAVCKLEHEGLFVEGIAANAGIAFCHACQKLQEKEKA